MTSPTFTGTYDLTHETLPWGRAIVARGELDVGALADLRERLEAALAAGADKLLMDLDAVTFIDSLSLAAIVGAKRRMGADGRLVIASGHPYVLLILEASGLDVVIEVFSDREAAEVSLLAR